MDIKSVLIEFFIHIANTAILFAVLWSLVYKPVTGYLDKRQNGIESDLKRARDSAAAAAEQQKQLAAHRAEQEREADEFVQDSRRRAEAQAAQILARAKSDAEAAVEAAAVRAEQERTAAIAGLQNEITDIAVDIAKVILAREVTKQDNQATIDAFFKEVE